MKITSHWIWVMSTTTWLLPPPHIVIGTTKMSYNMSKQRLVDNITNHCTMDVLNGKKYPPKSKLFFPEREGCL